ncbi:acyl-CoA dehydrogenase family protein [Streptomyces flaveolus]|uniref:acyl-CoA dehydrogenase family protein n=1 Tax=Streptomyces flaveolus TaxID=67297 RepID=UPI00380907FA
MKRVVPGKLGLTGAHMACARAAVTIAGRYSTQRMTFALGKMSVPLIEHQAHRHALVGALARTYAMSLLVARARRELDACSGQATSAVERLVAATKVNASRAAEQVVLVCRERCGAQGMFSRNRIADYIAFSHLVVTSEGDNDMRSGYRPVTETPAASSDLRDTRFLTWCLRQRERRLHVHLGRHVTACFEKGTGRFALWNAVVGDLLALTRAHGLRMAGEELQSALDGAAAETESTLLPVSAVFALQEIAVDAHWYLPPQAARPR